MRIRTPERPEVSRRHTLWLRFVGSLCLGVLLVTLGGCGVVDSWAPTGDDSSRVVHVAGEPPVFQVKPGPPVFLDRVIPEASSGSGESSTPYSDRTVRIQGTIRVRAVDKTQETLSDPPYTHDTATVVARLTTADSTDWTVVLQTVNARKADGSPRLFGGLGTDVIVHGDSGRENRLLPKMDALLTMWGSSEVYRNGELIREEARTHVMINSRTRNPDTGKFYGYDTTDRPVKEVYLLLYASNQLPTPGGFLNVY